MASTAVSCMDDPAAYWCGPYGLGGPVLEAPDEGGKGRYGIPRRLMPLMKSQEHGAYGDFALRLSMLPPKEEGEAEGTPRTQAGESDAADDSSTSTGGRAAHGARAPGAGVVKSPQRAPVDDWFPWKVQAPSYGPFGGPFGAFPGFLANVDAANSSSWWGVDEGEPQMVTCTSVL